MSPFSCGIVARSRSDKWGSDQNGDWGHARDYVEAMWRILQQNRPADFVIATGVWHSVREFVDAAAARLRERLGCRPRAAESLEPSNDRRDSSSGGPSS